MASIAGERRYGHSYGAWLVRNYQATHPSEVAALVLAESGASDPVRWSRRGKQIIAARSGHHVHLDEPALVVTTIRDVVGRVGP